MNKPTQEGLDYIAKSLQIQFKLEENGITTRKEHRRAYKARVKLTNNGSENIDFRPFEIYFYEHGGALRLEDGLGFKVQHVNGDLYCFVTTSCFGGLKSGQSIDMLHTAGGILAAKTDIAPNW